MRRYILLLLTLSVTMALEHRNNMRSHHREKRELLRRTKRRWVLSTIEIVEEDKGPFPKNATQLFNDHSHKYDLIYSIGGHGVDEDPLGIFSINKETGQVLAHGPIDREVHKVFHIWFDVSDKLTGDPVDNQLSFEVEIKDINDNAPVFDKRLKKASIKESQQEGRLPISLSATDKDAPNTDNSKISMNVIKQEPALPKIVIDNTKGSDVFHLNLTGCFNYDKAKEYKIIVRATDHGSPRMSSTETVILNIEDSNTHPPVFKKAQHAAEVMENSENKVILKMAVTDKDTPQTPGWRAKYTILEGNEAGNYMVETDPETNDGILILIKGKDYEVTRKAHLVIGVENEEPLFVCGTKGDTGGPAPQTTDVTITVIDTNDAPVFNNKEERVFQKEEMEPGKEIYRPTATDVDSEDHQIRYALAQDLAKWMAIDPKTGVVKTAQKLDRESEHVNNSIYTVLIHAIDDGNPPMTGTSTLLIHLVDTNDNKPFLLEKKIHICGNKGKSVEIQGKDYDEDPYAGPFFFSLRDKSQEKQWMLNPDTGEKSTLMSIKNLPFQTYTVPLTIADQQGSSAEEDLQVTVCDCGTGSECKDLQDKSSALGGAAIATLFAGILMFLLLLSLSLFCGVQGEKHKPMDFQAEGQQTLIRYNEEGGGSEYKAMSPLHVMSPAPGYAFTDGVKQANIPLTAMSPGYRHSEVKTQALGMGMGMGTFDSGMNMEGQWSSRKSSASARLKHTHTQKLTSSTKVWEQIEMMLEHQREDELDYPPYLPQMFAYEGTGSRCQSLDKLSLSNCGDDLDFLEHLDPKFNTLGGICRQATKEKGRGVVKL